MSQQGPGSGTGGEPPPPPPQRPTPTAPVFRQTPNAEKYVLEADAMRRRQLRSALLHGSDRTWREHRKVWPALAVGAVVSAVIIAGITVADALEIEVVNRQRQEQQQREQTREQERAEELQKQEDAERRRQLEREQKSSPGPSTPTARRPAPTTQQPPG